jgi:hypothetical protein
MSPVAERATLERHGVALPEGLVERALREVLALGESDGGFSSGRVELEGSLPEAAAELNAMLREELIEPLGRRERLRFAMSFLKAGDGDAPADQMFAPATMADPPRVVRVLLNLSEYPRRVLLWNGDAAEEVLIPGRRCGALHALQYVASEVPHCGINDALGYFLVSYEAPV